MEASLEYRIVLKYSLWLATMFGFCPTLVAEQVFDHHETVAESARASFEQKLDRRVRFATAGRTLVASIVELAFTYKLPTGIEYADREATTRPLNLHFQNESVRRILEVITEQVPGYSVSFSGGIVDVFAARGREDPSNLLNKVIKDFTVSHVDTRDADFQLFCAVGSEVGSQGCSGSLALGQWGPLKITLRLQNAKVYEVLNAIVAENGKAIWTVMVRPDKLSKLPQVGGIWYVYSLQQPFKAVVSDRLEHPKLAEERQLTPKEVESLRKRNECEQRFYDKKIVEIDGVSVLAACKQNPERRP